MLLRDFTLELITQYPHLSATLTVGDFVCFATLAAEVEHVAGESLRLSPARFPFAPFFDTALSVPTAHNQMQELWRLSYPVLRECRINPQALIRDFGVQQQTTQLPERFLRSPLTKCIICTPNHSYALHVHSRINGYLHDLDGVHTVQTVTLNCSNPACETMYKPSFYTRGAERYYYTPDMGRNKDYLHIHCHYYMSSRLAYTFRVLQMLGHVSHFNLVNWFNTIFVDDMPTSTFSPGQMFSPSMSEEECRNSLILHSLMKHADRRGTRLVVSSTGTDNLRFEAAIESHLDLLLLEGTKYRDHFCSSCVRVLPDSIDPKTGEEYWKSIRAVVTDGVTMGHWRCSASTDQLREIARTLGQPMPEGPCTRRLDNINDRYCPHHFSLLGHRCRAQPCPKTCEPGQDTCDSEDHIKVWAAFKKRVTGNFSLTSILNRPGTNLPTDPTCHLNPETAEFEDLDSLRQADESQQAHENARDGGQSKAAGKYLLTRCRTHNEQLIVGPCGIILARKTFFNAESVSAVKDFLEETFPQGLPEVVFYDNACRLTEHIYSGDTERSQFLGTVIPVDPFHHRSHADSDEFCKLFTDPHLFPDIQEGGRWSFNASAAELTNIWFGGYASMCRNMHPLLYNLFLEEMIYLRNMWLTKKLDKRKGMEFLGEGVLK